MPKTDQTNSATMQIMRITATAAQPPAAIAETSAFVAAMIALIAVIKTFMAIFTSLTIAVPTKPNMLIDIQTKMQQGYGEGFRQWATTQYSLSHVL